MTQKTPIKKNPLFYGVMISIAFALFILWIGSLPYCEPDKSGCISKFAKLSRSSPNEIGDALAGVASSLAFLWIIITVLLQSQELAAQRNEIHLGRKATEQTNEMMDKQLFENTFFSILTTFNEIIKSTDLVNSNNGTITTGRDCYSVFYTRLTKKFRKSSGSEKVRLEHAYSAFWGNHQSELGHYFRFLYRAFKILSESEHTKEYHVKLLRSQLSEQELLLLFYNCLSPQGSKFKPLAEKFALFDNMPAYKLLDKKHISLIDKASFGSNNMEKPKPLHELEKTTS